MSTAYPPLNALRAFEAAARRLSFTKAAEDLDVTPGAISQQVKILEDFVGQPLFRRLGRAVELTDSARASMPLLREAFERIDDAVRQMRLPLRRERVSVSAAPSFASKWLVPRIDRFQAANPDVQVWVAADMNLVDFAYADVDLAVRYGPGFYEGVTSEMLMGEEVLPVCSPALLEGSKPLRTPQDLVGHTLLHDVSPDNDPSCPDWSMWLTARGVPRADGNQGLRFNQSAMVIDAAASGRGVALAKRAIAAADLQSGRLVAPFSGEGDKVGFAYWLVRPKGRTMTPALKAFLDWIKSEATGDDWVI
ncbi:transcriptional regulator GcvA [Aquidulcibacter sp.]|uniref:transcriptional regulator GcvA n=1 Tax=Aquidulcibacter sp. TaxID=2052990 RepID=UPI000BC99E84|nr:MAG: LysR family transcriptional regulator [Alphaproteobacteria bacterium PA1]